jgi:hypothetical protein
MANPPRAPRIAMLGRFDGRFQEGAAPAPFVTVKIAENDRIITNTEMIVSICP